MRFVHIIHLTFMFIRTTGQNPHNGQQKNISKHLFFCLLFRLKVTYVRKGPNVYLQKHLKQVLALYSKPLMSS